jgi:hypothetical protein
MTTCDNPAKQNLYTVFDSASGDWPIDGDGKGQFLLTYADSWGGYYNGIYYPTNLELAKAKHPKAFCIQISVRPQPEMRGVAGYDVENGALTPMEACGLANYDIVHLKRRPFLYGSLDTITELRYTMEHFFTDNVNNVDYWLADPLTQPTVPPGFIAKQYKWEVSYDVSVILASAHCLLPGDLLRLITE